jgi:hypothetical protein
MAHQSRSGIVRAAVFATVALLASSPSHAYLDPGTGSIILQSALAGIAVAIGFLRFYWQRFKAFLSSLTGSTSRADIRDDQDIAQETDTGNST